MKSKHLHPDDGPLWDCVSDQVVKMAQFYGLALKGIRPMRRKHTVTKDGHCTDTGIIRITIRKYYRGRWMRKPESAHEILNTVAHELAHLKFFNHQIEWFRLYSKILNHLADFQALTDIRKLTQRD